MKIDTKTITIQLQKYIVHSKEDAKEKPWIIDELLSSIIVYIFPLYQKILKDPQKFTNLNKVFSSYYKSNRDRLMSFDQEALAHAITNEWCTSIEDKFSLINPISPLFESIDENNLVHLRENTFDGLLEKPFDDLERPYGTNDYCPPGNRNVTKVHPPQKKGNHSDEKVKGVQEELVKLIKNLVDVRKGNSQCYRHDIFTNLQLEDINTYPQYTWQWNLTCSEYNNIKNTLSYYHNVLIEVIKKNVICCKLLQIYVSEWYKREYNGYDRTGNALQAININDQNAPKLICNTLGVTDKSVYWSDIDESGNPSGQREWLGSIYVNGGLPLNYLLKKENSTFRSTIEDIIIANMEGNEYSTGDLVALCGNQVVNQSYRAKTLFPNKDASIFDFIQEAILNENVIIDGFEDFSTLVRESNEKVLKQKFELRYQAYKTSKCFQLIPQLYLKKEPNNIHYAISQKRLDEWGVQPQNDRFILSIEADGTTILKKQFDKCVRGDFITFPKKDRFDLKIDHQLCIKKWNVWIDGKMISERTAITNNLWEKGYIQMYSEDGFFWQSRPNGQSNYSAVLFDKSRDNSLNDREDSSIVINGQNSEVIGWKSFKESLSFTIDGKEIKLYNKTGSIFVEYKTVPELAKHYPDDDYKFIICGERPSFNIIYVKDNDGESGIVLKDTDCIWEYRYGTEGSFLDMSTIDKLGYVELQLTLKSNKKQKTIKCFSIDKELHIRNVCERNTQKTDFVNFRTLDVYYKDQKLVNDNGTRRKFWGNMQDNDYRHPTATYQITDGVVHFDIKYDKPIDATIVEKENETVVGVGRKNTPLRLPILTLGKVNIRQLPNDETISINKHKLNQLSFDAFLNHNYTDRNPISKNTYIVVQTFTHQVCVGQDISNLDLANLNFVFVPTNNPRSCHSITLNPNDRERFGIKTDEEGIIVQCTNKYETPLILLKPIYIPPKDENQQLTEFQRISRINDFNSNYENHSSDYREALAYFDVAAETGMYFGVFDALLGLMCKYADLNETSLGMSENAAEHLANFFKQYVEQSKIINYSALWRMADEFLFDWNLIPKNVWRNLFGNDLTPIEKLLNLQPHHFNSLSIELRANPNIKDNNLNIILRTITSSFGRGRNSREQASFWQLPTPNRISVLNTLSEISFDTFNRYIQ